MVQRGIRRGGPARLLIAGLMALTAALAALPAGAVADEGGRSTPPAGRPAHCYGNRDTQPPTSVRATDYEQRAIYHSPQTPGYTSFVGAWTMPDKSLMTAFAQSTGPLDPSQRTLAPDWVKDALGAPNFPAARDHWGLTNVTKFLRSTDDGATWQSYREDPMITPGGYPTIHPAPFFPQADIALSDGTLVRRVNGEDIRYDTTIRGTAYLQRLAPGASTWSAPQYLLDPDRYTYQLSRIRYLCDGRLIALGERWDAPAGERTGSTPVHWLLMVSDDEGLTWSNALTIGEGVTEPHANEWDVAELPDGDLLAVMRTRPLTGGREQVRLQALLVKHGDGWTMTDVKSPPFGHSGHPELLATREGAILHIATNDVEGQKGIWYLSDAAAEAGSNGWKLLPFSDGAPRSSFYYPRSLESRDGTVYVFSHVGGDDDYGERDQSIVMQKFRLKVTEGTAP